MNLESANSPDGESKTESNIEIDISNPETWDFAERDQDDDLANQEPGAEGTEEDTDQDGTGGDELPVDPDAADGDDQPEPDAANDDHVVVLSGGEKVPVKELKEGYLRQRDYTLKTQEVANTRRSLGQLSDRVTNTAAAIANFLAEQLPEEPTPALAMTDPGAYTSKKAIYEAAVHQIQQLMHLGAAPKQIGEQLTGEERKEMIAREHGALIKAFPEIAKPEAQKQFFDGAFDAANELGFSDAELKDVTDHRYFKLAHYARLGMQAEAAKKKAMAKVAVAPPIVPNGKSRSANAQRSRGNTDAMAKLRKSGSLQDALAIDFD